MNRTKEEKEAAWRGWSFCALLFFLIGIAPLVIDGLASFNLLWGGIMGVLVFLCIYQANRWGPSS